MDSLHQNIAEPETHKPIAPASSTDIIVQTGKRTRLNLKLEQIKKNNENF